MSPQGNDAWSGALQAPSADDADGPLRTLVGARDRLRAMRAAGNSLGNGAQVFILKGEYELDAPLALDAQDSGIEDAKISWQALVEDSVQILAGRRIENWEKVTDAALLERLPEAARAHVVQADLRALGVTDYGSPSGGGLYLYSQRQPMTLARWPNEGFVKIAETVGGDPVTIHGRTGDKIGKWTYGDDRPAGWSAELDVWVHGYWFWDWSDQRQKVKQIDATAKTIEVEPPYHGYGYRNGQWYYYYNVFSEIDTPGEWYLDRAAGTLYFWPPDDDTSDTYVSVLDDAVTMDGVSHVSFFGVGVEGSRQHAFVMRNATAVSVYQGKVRNIGGDAIVVDGGREAVIAEVELYNLGGSGISLSGGDRRTLTHAVHQAGNNHIHDYSQWSRMYHPAITLSGVGNRAIGNYIHDAPHMAIYFSGNDHLIEHNEIHDVCLESNDAGAIYAGRDWTMRGTVIRNNYLHNITGFRGEGCVGVYLDDMFCGTRIENNLFYRVTRAAFIGGGRDNVVAGNIFVECNPALHIDDRAMNWAADTVPTTMMERLNAMPYQDALWAERYPELPRILDGDPAEPTGNVVENNASLGGRWDEISQAIRHLVEMRENSVLGEPSIALPESHPRAPDFAAALGVHGIRADHLDLERMDRRPE